MSPERTIVFATFESPRAPGGGLAAVMDYLPRQLAGAERVLLLTPYHERIAAARNYAGTFRPAGEFAIGFAGAPARVRLLQDPAAPVPSYHLQIDGRFQGYPNPYVETYPASLLHDALLFSAAVPRALVQLGATRDLIVNLEDWETACVIQTLRETPAIERAACLLTLHNPYDHPASHGELDWIMAGAPPLGTVLQAMLSVHTGPVSTVSPAFARELTGAPLFTHVFADHLQGLLRWHGVFGVDNGMFGPHVFPYSERAGRAAGNGRTKLLAGEKAARRRLLARTLDEYEGWLAGELAAHPGRGAELMSWGEPLDLADPELPVFFMMGRDDPRQKGYDVAAAAIERMPPGRARYIFAPIPGAEGLGGLGFLWQLARDRPGEVKVFCHRLPKPSFDAVLRGSSFLLMPSLYEPFGAANEAYLTGMPVVARATGGLTEQVIDQPPEAACGVLFGEGPVADEVADWRRLMACDYPPGERVAGRAGIPLFESMVDALQAALAQAVRVHSDREEYGRMIWNGWRRLDEFTWERAAAGYRRIYDAML